jgi:hypothetical protein
MYTVDLTWQLLRSMLLTHNQDKEGDAKNAKVISQLGFQINEADSIYIYIYNPLQM